jgi:hypothetical protein
MAGAFYPPPPVFIGGRQPYAPLALVPASAPAPVNAPTIGGVDKRVLNIILRGWQPDVIWIQGQEELAPIASYPPPPAPGPVIPISVAQQMALRMTWEPPFMFPPQVGYIGALPGAPVFIIMPNLVGLRQADAQTELANNGLPAATVTTAFSTTVPAGLVISQSPVAGTHVNSLTATSIVVAFGPTIPNVVGLDYLQACQILSALGLVVMIGEIPSAYRPGLVLSQAPPDGVGYIPRQVVNIIVSEGSLPAVDTQQMVPLI